jgi:hypothetical protein
VHSGTEESNNTREKRNLKRNRDNNKQRLDPYVSKRKRGSRY